VDRIVLSYVASGGFDMERELGIFCDTAVPVIYPPHWAQSDMSFMVLSQASLGWLRLSCRIGAAKHAIFTPWLIG
jgi:hypothetical protein